MRVITVAINYINIGKNIEQKSEYLNQSRREGLDSGVDELCQCLSTGSEGENAWRDAGQVDQEVPASAV